MQRHPLFLVDHKTPLLDTTITDSFLFTSGDLYELWFVHFLHSHSLVLSRKSMEETAFHLRILVCILIFTNVCSFSTFTLHTGK